MHAVGVRREIGDRDLDGFGAEPGRPTHDFAAAAHTDELGDAVTGGDDTYDDVAHGGEALPPSRVERTEGGVEGQSGTRPQVRAGVVDRDVSRRTDVQLGLRLGGRRDERALETGGHQPSGSTTNDGGVAPAVNAARETSATFNASWMVTSMSR